MVSALDPGWSGLGSSPGQRSSFALIAEFRLPDGTPSGAPYPIGEQTIPMNRLFMVITVSGFARGRVRTTTTTTTTTATESRKMAATLQLKG